MRHIGPRKTKVPHLNTTPRKYLLCAYWQRHPQPEAVTDFLENTLNKSEFDPRKVDVVVAPINAYMDRALELLNKNMQIASQTLTLNGPQPTCVMQDWTPDTFIDKGVKWLVIGVWENPVNHNEGLMLIEIKL